MFAFVSRRLSRQVLFVLAVSVAAFMAAIVYIVDLHQTNDMIREMLASSEYMEHLIYSGIKYPMTIGHKEQVERELLEIGETNKDIDIFICDREQNIVFSSQKKALKSRISAHVSNNAFLETFADVLKTGHDPELTFEDKTNGLRSILTLYPLLNQKECYQCHGSSHKVLGSMVIKKNAEKNYAAIYNFRNFNIMASLTGIIALTILMKIILSRLVRRPLEDITANIDELTVGIPQGNYSSRINIKRPDEIGTLINSFNGLADTLEQKNNELENARTELAGSYQELKIAKKDLEDINYELEQRVEERTKELRVSEENVRAFATRLAEAEEHERKRLSRELHDQVGQHMSVLGINLNIIRSQATTDLPEKVYSRIDDSIALVEEVVEKTRNIMADLRPPVLDDYGLPAALKWYTEKFSSRTGTKVYMETGNIASRPPAKVENALFRIVQEVLTNVAKHAKATEVRLSMELDANVLRLEISDNGTGFNPELKTAQNKWGLINMAERADAIGGVVTIDTTEGGGTSVIVAVRL